MVTKINGDIFVIDEVLLSINTIRLVGSGGVRLEVDCDEFYEKFSSGEYVLNDEVEVAEFNGESDAEKEEAKFRVELLDLYNKLLEKCLRKPEIESAISRFCFKKGHKPVRLRTVHEYYKKYADGNYAALVPNYRGRGVAAGLQRKIMWNLLKRKR